MLSEVFWKMPDVLSSSGPIGFTLVSCDLASFNSYPIVVSYREDSDDGIPLIGRHAFSYLP